MARVGMYSTVVSLQGIRGFGAVPCGRSYWPVRLRSLTSRGQTLWERNHASARRIFLIETGARGHPLDSPARANDFPLRTGAGLGSQVVCCGVTRGARRWGWRLTPSGACSPPSSGGWVAWSGHLVSRLVRGTCNRPRLRSCATSRCPKAKRPRSSPGRPDRAERSEPRSGRP